ncbi:TonB-dependent receptor [Croceibacterium ferulae]|uniref:TonB-dependent receptor n=1 Tax=Croceibacterium ferulae TaxID=1854641 RepID=UPI000EAF5C4A|nr:TonB-dependent receptor [Croceibacterium ferulae]
MSTAIRVDYLRRALLGVSLLVSVPALAQGIPPGDQPDPTVPTPANPDQTDAADPAANQTLPAAEAGSGEILVTGFRQSYANAIANKRNQVAITDGISSDGLGRFPDLNVGEALQRVPGVQINREAEGRNATINLRGLPGEYARLTLNGVAFAEPILNEAAPLGAFNSDIFSGIIVNKSPLADAQSGGLSGNVDLQIAPALGRKDGGSLKFAYEYNSLGEKFSPAATASYNYHLSDSFAVFGVVAYKRENFRRDSLLFNGYLPFSPAQAQAGAAVLAPYYAQSADCPSCTGATTTQGALYNSQVRQYSRLNEGNLFSGAAGAEYEISDEAKIGVTGFLTDRNLPKTRQYLLIASNNTFSSFTNLGSPVALDDGRYVVEEIGFSNADVVSSSRDNAQHQKAWGINGNATWENDDWRASMIGTVSRAANESVEIGLDFETLPLANGNGVTGTINTGGGELDDFAFTLQPDPAVTTRGIPNGYWGGLGLSQAWLDQPTLAASSNRFNFQGTQSYAENELYANQIDLERKLDGFISGLQVGARFESNTFTSRGYRINAYGLPVENIEESMLVTSPTADDFLGNNGSPTLNWQVLDLDRILSALQPVEVYPGAELAPVGYNINYNDNSFQLYNFSNRNDVISAYGQVKLDFEVGGIGIRGNVGLRYEHTDNTIEALDRVRQSTALGSPADFAVNTFDNSYSKWLPSAIAIVDLADDLVVRAAAYRTYVRPQPRQFSPITVVGAPNNGVISLALGNPELEPYNSTSLDLSIEWYNRPNSLISLAAFQKRITGLIATVNDPTVLCPSDGSAYGLGTLTVVGDQCQSSLTYESGGVTLPFLVAATGFVNQNEPITVRGIEANIQQSFDFLPGALSNLGGGANYAFTDISGRTATGAEATLPGVSKHNVNVIAYYETPVFGIRAVYNLRSSYDLASAGTFTGAARQVRARGQLDMSGSVNLTDSISLSVDAFNLTNAVRYEYENQVELPRRYDFDGRTFTATVRAIF